MSRGEMYLTRDEAVARLTGQIEGVLRASGQITNRGVRCVMVPIVEAERWLETVAILYGDHPLRRGDSADSGEQN